MIDEHKICHLYIHYYYDTCTFIVCLATILLHIIHMYVVYMAL